jgi:hypothetical protein
MNLLLLAQQNFEAGARILLFPIEFVVNQTAYVFFQLSLFPSSYIESNVGEDFKKTTEKIYNTNFQIKYVASINVGHLNFSLNFVRNEAPHYSIPSPPSHFRGMYPPCKINSGLQSTNASGSTSGISRFETNPKARQLDWSFS